MFRTAVGMVTTDVPARTPAPPTADPATGFDPTLIDLAVREALT